MSEIDAELVRRTMAGDRQAFEALVVAHLPRGRAIARAVLGDDPAVDDVVQEAFVRAYQRLGQLGDGATFPAWLSTIVRNEAISWLRRNPRSRSMPMESADGITVQEPGERREDPQLDSLRGALARLPAQYREIIALKYEAGLNYDQIAETLGLSVPNVEKRLYRARQALLQLMPDLG